MKSQRGTHLKVRHYKRFREGAAFSQYKTLKAIPRNRRAKEFFIGADYRAIEAACRLHRGKPTRLLAKKEKSEYGKGRVLGRPPCKLLFPGCEEIIALPEN